VRTYGRNEDHIHNVKIHNDFELSGDYVCDSMKTQILLFNNCHGQTIMDDYYYYNFNKPKYERDCDFCYDRLDTDDNRFNDFIRNFDIVNHTNHFDYVFDPKNYNYDHDLKPCWCNNMPQFSRSSVGGSKYLLSAQPYALDPDDLIFESRFESSKSHKITMSFIFDPICTRIDTHNGSIFVLKIPEKMFNIGEFPDNTVQILLS
jgi:hypothetical protein